MLIKLLGRVKAAEDTTYEKGAVVEFDEKQAEELIKAEVAEVYEAQPEPQIQTAPAVPDAPAAPAEPVVPPAQPAETQFAPVAPPQDRTSEQIARDMNGFGA